MNRPGSIVAITPSPVTLDGQRVFPRIFNEGETLGRFLERTVPDWDADDWEVRVDGYIVPPDMVHRIRPKDGTVVEVRGTVHRAALQIIAIAALTYFTFGIGAATAGMWGAGAVAGALGGGVAGALLAGAVYVGGTVLINKVLGPKMPKLAADNDPVYSIGGARNQIRQYQPLPILFGTMKITPDVISMPYTWYQGDDQYLAMVLTPGVNVHRIETLYNGDTPLSSYEGVSTYLNGLGYHANQEIPIFTNVDTVAGGELEPGSSDYVTRTSSEDAVILVIDLEGRLCSVSSKGKIEYNHVEIHAQYREVGSGTWLPFEPSGLPLRISNGNTNIVRRTRTRAVPRGQYEVRVRASLPYEAKDGDQCEMTWVALKTYQPDEADYDGISRFGVMIKATGQLNGVLDEVNTVAHAAPIPLWNGSSWSTVETSNPGAHILKYARGYFNNSGRIIAGMGLADSQIDIEALQAFMVHCTANGYEYNAYIKDARNHQQMLDAIALAGMGQISWAGGKLSVVWAADGQPITAVANMANIKRASFQVNYTLANAADGIEASPHTRG